MSHFINHDHVRVCTYTRVVMINKVRHHCVSVQFMLMLSLIRYFLKFSTSVVMFG